MILAHKIRLKPNQEGKRYFAKACGTARFVFNWGLARWKELFEAGQPVNKFSLEKEFNGIKRDQYPWVVEVTKCAPERAFDDLGQAFAHFFRGVKTGKKIGYPKFKKKGKSTDSFYLSND